MLTDHSQEIAQLRHKAGRLVMRRRTRLTLLTAADLLEIHDATGISLDHWSSARGLVERLIGAPIDPNGA